MAVAVAALTRTASRLLLLLLLLKVGQVIEVTTELEVVMACPLNDSEALRNLDNVHKDTPVFAFAYWLGSGLLRSG